MANRFARSLRAENRRLTARSDVGNREIASRNLGFLEKVITRNSGNLWSESLCFDPYPSTETVLRRTSSSLLLHVLRPLFLMQICVSHQGTSHFTGVVFCYTPDTLLTRLLAFCSTAVNTILEWIGLCIYTRTITECLL